MDLIVVRGVDEIVSCAWAEVYIWLEGPKLHQPIESGCTLRPMLCMWFANHVVFDLSGLVSENSIIVFFLAFPFTLENDICIEKILLALNLSFNARNVMFCVSNSTFYVRVSISFFSFSFPRNW